MDKLSTLQRHANMAAIHGKDTKPEMIVRRWLWRHGFRYRLNHKRLPGKPDIVMRKYRTCIFVNGCFWHGHNVELPQGNREVELPQGNREVELPQGNREVELPQGERNVELPAGNLSDSTEQVHDMIESSACCKIPKTNREFWVNKIRRNKERDIRVQRELASMGWHTITVWECELKPDRRERTLKSLAFTLNKIFLQDRTIRPYEIYEEVPMMAAEEL